MENGSQTWDIADGSCEQVGPRSFLEPDMLILKSHEELRKWNLAHGPLLAACAPPPTLAQAPTWAQLVAARALHPNAQMPRVPCMPRRKATMLESSGDGIADLLLLDSTGDGVADQPVSSVAVDTTGDGRTDALIADSNGDGRGDCLVLDTSGDGIPDTAVVGMRYLRLQRKNSEKVAKGGNMWSPEEDAAIQEMMRKHGNKWTLIAKHLPGRSDNAVRNRMRVLLAQL